MIYRKSVENNLHKGKDIVDTAYKNLINMKDDRDPIYGKLHTVKNTSQLVRGQAQQSVVY